MKDQKGFGLVESLLITLVLAVVGFGGYYVWHSKNQTKASSASKTNSQSTKLNTINNYYDCWDKKGATDSSSDNNCTIDGVTYVLPTNYTANMIRGYSKVPYDALPLVEQIAQKTFSDCSTGSNPLPSEIQIYDVINDKFLYVGVACDGGHRELLYKDSTNKWQEIDLGQMGLSCSIADKYKVPAELLLNAGNDEKAICYNSDGTTSKLSD